MVGISTGRRIIRRSLVIISLSAGLHGCEPSGPAPRPSSAAAPDLSAWELPTDLPDHLEGLTTLELSGPVDRIDWLGDGLRTLALRGTSVTSLEGVPSTLEDLYLCNSPIASLGNLPSGLRHLDLRYTHLTEVGDGLPQGLRFLAIGSAFLSEPPALPEGLVRLEVAETPRLPNAGAQIELGSGLVALAWTGGDKIALPVALADIDTLVVQGTSIRQLDHLPSISHLVLLNNEGLEGFRLPGGLLSLTLDELEHPVLGHDLPRSLRVLELKRVSLSGADSWPLSLRSLKLVLANIEWGSVPTLLQDLILEETEFPPELPDGLRTLSVRGMGVMPEDERRRIGRAVRSVAGTLEALALDQAYPGVDLSVFSSLRELELPGNTLTSSDALPANLESLTLHGSIASLPELPASLRTLDLTECWDVSGQALDRVLDASGLETLILRDTDVTALTGLPESLQVLDLSGTELGSLPTLPPGFERLVLHLGQVPRLGTAPSSLRSLSFVPTFPRTPCPELALEVEPR